MDALRFLLLVFSLAGSAFMAYIALVEGHSRGIAIPYAIGLSLNSIYLAAVRQETRSSRVFGLANLWLETKKAELKKRTKIANQD